MKVSDREFDVKLLSFEVFYSEDVETKGAGTTTAITFLADGVLYRYMSLAETGQAERCFVTREDKETGGRERVYSHRPHEQNPDGHYYQAIGKALAVACMEAHRATVSAAPGEITPSKNTSRLAAATKPHSSTPMRGFVFDIAKDGLYDENDESLHGRIAFIFDGEIVSGHVLDNGNWEADSDVGRHGEFDKDSVKKYVIFDKPVWML